jgi:Na+(H+)/acetate symporter ActP
VHAVDILIIVVYVVAVGLRSRKVASQSLEEYFLAGRTLKGWQAGVSMAAKPFYYPGQGDRLSPFTGLKLS